MPGRVHARGEEDADVREQLLVRQGPAVRVADAQQLSAEALVIIGRRPCAKRSDKVLTAARLGSIGTPSYAGTPYRGYELLRLTVRGPK